MANEQEISTSGGLEQLGGQIDRSAEQDTELHNIDVCSEIGLIAGSNCHYTAGLSRRIAVTGKAIEDLTVGELLTLQREYNEWFNKLYA